MSAAKSILLLFAFFSYNGFLLPAEAQTEINPGYFLGKIVLKVDFNEQVLTGKPQIAVWLEDRNRHFTLNLGITEKSAVSDWLGRADTRTAFTCPIRTIPCPMRLAWPLPRLTRSLTGQPSVVWRAEIEIGDSGTMAELSYTGFGRPRGENGKITYSKDG